MGPVGVPRPHSRLDVEHAQIRSAIAERQTELAATLAEMSDDELIAPSQLPEWNRLTVVCHLRYGAEATRRMVVDVLDGKRTTFYPGGRDVVRPATLRARPGEAPRDVVQAFVDAAAALDATLAELDATDWALVAEEPAGTSDLGSISLATLALLRLTEVEVHGTDLDAGLRPWSDTFVDAALPMRLRWLVSRRSNDRPIDENLRGTWVIAPAGWSSFAVTVSATDVTVAEGDEPIGDVRLGGTGRELLAFILGRLPLEALTVTGAVDLAAKYHLAFPGP